MKLFRKHEARYIENRHSTFVDALDERGAYHVLIKGQKTTIRRTVEDYRPSEIVPPDERKQVVGNYSMSGVPDPAAKLQWNVSETRN